MLTPSGAKRQRVVLDALEPTLVPDCGRVPTHTVIGSHAVPGLPLLTQHQFVEGVSPAYVDGVLRLVDLLHASCTDPACCSPQPSAGLSGCPVVFAQRVTSANKGLTLLTPTVVIKGPVDPRVAARVQQRCAFFSRPSWRPQCHLIWRGVQDTRGAWWLYSPNVDSHGRLPAEVEWARVYNYRPPAYTCGFFDGAGTSGSHGVCTVWGWMAVRGSLPRDSEAMRVKDAFDSGCRPSQPVMENLCVSYRCTMAMLCVLVLAQSDTSVTVHAAVYYYTEQR